MEALRYISVNLLELRQLQDYRSTCIMCFFSWLKGSLHLIITLNMVVVHDVAYNASRQRLQAIRNKYAKQPKRSINSDDLCPSQIERSPPRLTDTYAHITRSTYMKVRGFCLFSNSTFHPSENALLSGSSEPPALVFLPDSGAQSRLIR